MTDTSLTGEVTIAEPGSSHSEWYPDRQLRLFYADHGKWGELNLHEKFMMSNGATIGKLKRRSAPLAILLASGPYR